MSIRQTLIVLFAVLVLLIAGLVFPLFGILNQDESSKDIQKYTYDYFGAQTERIFECNGTRVEYATYYTEKVRKIKFYYREKTATELFINDTAVVPADDFDLYLAPNLSFLKDNSGRSRFFAENYDLETTPRYKLNTYLYLDPAVLGEGVYEDVANCEEFRSLMQKYYPLSINGVVEGSVPSIPSYECDYKELTLDDDGEVLYGWQGSGVYLGETYDAYHLHGRYATEQEKEKINSCIQQAGWLGLQSLIIHEN